MGILSKTRRVFTSFFGLRPDKWVDYGSLKSNTSYLFTLLKSLFHIEKIHQTETFEEAIARLNLSNEDLKNQSKRFSFLTYFFLGLAVFILSYGLWVYLLKGNIMGGCMSFVLFLYALSHAFQYHFWNYQLKRQRLGCTFQEWLADITGLPFLAKLFPTRNR